MNGKVEILPVYYKKDLMKSFGCQTELTLLRRLKKLGIPYRVEGKDIYVLYEDIREAFRKQKLPEVHYRSKTNNILSEL